MKFSPMFLAVGAILAPFATQAAMYQLKELVKPDNYKQSFPMAINNANQSVVNLTSMYNFPVDLNAVDLNSAFIEANLTTAEYDDLKRGIISGNAQGVLEAYLQQGSANYSFQRFASVFAYRPDVGNVVKWRQGDLPTNNEYMMDINDNSVMLAVAGTPFTKQTFLAKATDLEPNPVPVKLWVPEPSSLSAYIQSAQGKFQVPAPYTENGGGFSYAKAISNSGYIVGYASVGMSESNVASLKSTCTGDDLPIALCLYGGSSSYETKAVLWKINETTGKPEVLRTLKYLGDKNTGEPHSLKKYAALTYVSTPYDVNNDGIAVGASLYSNSDDIRSSYYGDYVYNTTHASIFVGDEVLPIVNPNDYLSSAAYAINDKDIIVGSANKIMQSYERSKMFVYDYGTNTLRWVTDLFETATTVPAAINNLNIAVGKTEVFTAGTSTRRSVGFMADLTNDKFYDLNALIGCSAEYSIVSANAINDKNVIVATAIKEVDKRDNKGEVVKDSAGNVLKENIAVAVQLTPIANGTIDDCSAVKNETYERKGASSGLLALLLVPVAYWRRRRA
jgi:hypothetical protein